MRVAAKIGVTTLNKVFDVCMWRMILMLVVVCICALFCNAKFFHEFVKSRPADAEISSCGSNSTGVFLECLLNHFAFDLLARLFETRCRGCHVLFLTQLEIFSGQSRPVGHNDASFHAGLKFAPIPRP